MTESEFKSMVLRVARRVQRPVVNEADLRGRMELERWQLQQMSKVTHG